MNLFVIKFIKYCTVGLMGMATDFGVTWFFKEKHKLNLYIANSAGFVLAALLNYTLNKYWTFRTTGTSVPVEFVLFCTIALAGLVFNNLLVWGFHKKMNFNFYFSKLLAVGVVTGWNFFMNYYFTFVHN